MPPVFYWLSSVLLGLVLLRIVHRVHRRRRRRKEREEDRRLLVDRIPALLASVAMESRNAKVYCREDAGGDVRTLADPFMIQRSGRIFLFCEVILSSSALGKIAVSLYDETRDAWDYKAIVLDEPFHLSYPYVFSHRDDVYMIPVSKGARSIRLYRATGFPYEWTIREDAHRQLEAGRPERGVLERPLLPVRQPQETALPVPRGLADRRLEVAPPVARPAMEPCAVRGADHRTRRLAVPIRPGTGQGIRSGVHGFRVVELSAREFKEGPARG